MTMIKPLMTLALSATLVAASVTAQAQQGEAVRVRGTVTALSEGVITVQTAAGQRTTVSLAKDFRVLVYTPIKLTDVAPNAYVAVASSPTPEGGLRALGLVVFPEAMRGLNEGTKGWDLTPGSRMTNATVGQINQQGAGEIEVKFGKGETQKIQISDNTRVSTFTVGDVATITVGAKVVVFATKEGDGAHKSGMVGVGKDGYMPPV
jgi:hypothetical protein